MNKKILTAVLIFLAAAPAFASNTFSFKVGAYAPADLKAGIIWGADYGYSVDENVSILIGADLYYKNITDREDLGDTEKVGVTLETGRYLSEWKGLHLPLTAKVMIEFPMGDYSNFKPFMTAGLGFGFTHISFTDIEESTGDANDESLTYGGFVWQLGGGVLYRIGSRSNLLGEILYNSAKFEKDEDNGYYTTLNSSGLIIRAGFNVLMF